MSPKIPNRSREFQLYAQGYGHVVGIDEVGRGAWAGPMVVRACILKPKTRLDHIRDSKMLSLKQREQFYERLLKHCLCYGLGWVTAAEIDEIGMTKATILATQRALSELSVQPHYALCDHMPLPRVSYPIERMVRGDGKVTAIAAASIIAKVSRDRFMREQASLYAGYDFERNVGYPSPKHLNALATLGPSTIHRKLFLRKFNLRAQDTAVVP